MPAEEYRDKAPLNLPRRGDFKKHLYVIYIQQLKLAKLIPPSFGGVGGGRKI
jgi:hypothetical protein